VKKKTTFILMLGLFEKQRSMVLKAIQWNKYSSNADELHCPKHH
jgi:hypothetical protein